MCLLRTLIEPPIQVFGGDANPLNSWRPSRNRPAMGIAVQSLNLILGMHPVAAVEHHRLLGDPHAHFV
jgi:hypothetical protein